MKPLVSLSAPIPQPPAVVWRCTPSSTENWQLSVTSSHLFARLHPPKLLLYSAAYVFLAWYSKSPNQQIAKTNAVSLHNPSARTLSPSHVLTPPFSRKSPGYPGLVARKPAGMRSRGRGEKLDLGSIGPWF